MVGALPCSSYAMSETGWSNGQILKQYLKFITARTDPSEHILLIFDGHASHVSLDVIEWAKENKVVLFVLPPHTSHALQPLDVGCLGPFKATYYMECNLFMARTRGEVITKYNIAELSSKAYLKTMTPLNVTSAFKNRYNPI